MAVDVVSFWLKPQDLGDATLFAREDYVEEAWRIVDPALQAVVPRLMPEPQRLRALNGLFDVTGRLAVIAGSALAAAIAAVAAPIHLLTANSASFLASSSPRTWAGSLRICSTAVMSAPIVS